MSCTVAQVFLQYCKNITVENDGLLHGLALTTLSKVWVNLTVIEGTKCLEVLCCATVQY